MEKKSKLTSNLILAFGALFLFCGVVTLIISISAEFVDLAKIILPCVIMLVGFALLYSYIIAVKKILNFILGFFLSLTGFFTLIVTTGLIPFQMKQTWPFILLIASISLFVPSKVIYKRIVMAFDFPALFLFVMSINFALFSFQVFPFTFRQMMYFMVPILLILCGFFLVFLFIHRQKINDILKSDDSEFIEDMESETF